MKPIIWTSVVTLLSVTGCSIETQTPTSKEQPRTVTTSPSASPAPSPSSMVEAIRTNIKINEAWLQHAQFDLSQFISPDGSWILFNNQLEDLNAKTVPLPNQQQYIVYGGTPSDGVILGFPAGDGGVELSYEPSEQKVTQTFPMDKEAKHTEFATESVKGIWATLESDASGAGPSVQNWVDVNGKTVRGFDHAPGSTSMAWSPDGNTLAIATSIGNNPTKITFYGTNTGSEETIDVPSNQSVVPNSSPTLFQPIWSSDGKELGVLSGTNLRIINTTDYTSHLVSSTVDTWGWVNSNVIFTVNGNGELTFSSVMPVLKQLYTTHLTSQYDIKGVDDGVVVKTAMGSALEFISVTGKPVDIATDVEIWWVHDSDVYYIKAGRTTVWKVHLNAAIL